MTISEPKLWIGDSHTLDQPSESERQEVFGSVEDDEEELLLLQHDAI